jgi:hypothetical protein
LRRRVALAALLLLAAPEAARAGCACIDWASIPQALNLCTRNNNSGCDDSNLLPAPLDGMNWWNFFLGHWTRLAPSRQDDAPADGIHTVGRLVRASIQNRWGVAIPGQVLAVTTIPVTRFPGPPPGFCPLPPPGFYACQPADAAARLDVDITMVTEQPVTIDDEEAYNTFNTPQRKYAMRQIMIHEIGHAMGLQHEQATAAVMNPTYLQYRNVPMLADDVGTMRTYRPAIATDIDDPMIGGFSWQAGVTYTGATLAPAQVDAGTGVVTVNHLTVFNRSARPLPAGPVRVRFGNVPAADLQCPQIPAYGACALVAGSSVPVAWDLSGAQTVFADIPVLAGERLPADNVLKLGTVNIVAAPDQDQDGDGFRPRQGDCDDRNPAVHPGRAEDCDGRDQDCDRRVDEGPAGAGAALTRPCYGGPAPTRGVGLCRDGTQLCRSAAWVGGCVDERRPEAGFCDGNDHDCDGLPDLCLEPDAAIPDAAIPDAAIPDAAIPDAAIPDAAIPDAAIPDAAIPDAAIPDAAIPDAAIPDAAIPDAAVPVVDAAVHVVDAAHALDAAVVFFDLAGLDLDAAADAASPPLADMAVLNLDAAVVVPGDALPADAAVLPADVPAMSVADLGPPPADRPAMSTPDAPVAPMPDGGPMPDAGPTPEVDGAPKPGDARVAGPDGAALPDGAVPDGATPDGTHAGDALAGDARVDAQAVAGDATPDGAAEQDARDPAAEPDAKEGEAGGPPVARGNGCACDTAGGGAAVHALWPVVLLASTRRRRRQTRSIP